MKELLDIYNWLQSEGKGLHEIPRVTSLPDPVFMRNGRKMVSFSSNNYLGLANDLRLIAAAHKGLDAYGVANCESRLLGGDMDIYNDLEAKLAQLKGKEAALLFATGYLTNLGTLSSLTRTGMMARIYGFRTRLRHKYVYFSDEFNHVSIREGIRMSGVPKVNYRHCDMNDLEDKLKAADASAKIIVSDGVFSMDGDITPLPDLLRLADKYDAIVYIDDAHGTGVLGPNGGGTTEYFDINSPRLISMGTLSKAYGAIGGFIATETHIAEVLRRTCSAYGFTSTLPPDQVFAVAEAMRIVQDEPQHLQKLWSNQRFFVEGVSKLGFRLVSKDSCIVPIFIGDERKCERCTHALEENGFHVDSIVFPGVPIGQSRLRFNMNARHTHEQIGRLLESLEGIQRGNLK